MGPGKMVARHRHLQQAATEIPSEFASPSKILPLDIFVSSIILPVLGKVGTRWLDADLPVRRPT